MRLDEKPTIEPELALGQIAANGDVIPDFNLQGITLKMFRIEVRM